MDRRILIADDDTCVRQGAAELLVSSGLTVVEAGDGEEAMVVGERAFTAGEPLHLVLADVHMPPPEQPTDLGLEPGDGGLALFSLLQGQRPELPCILWSGAASDGVASWALRQGARAILRKPVQPLERRQAVHRVRAEVWGDVG